MNRHCFLPLLTLLALLMPGATAAPHGHLTASSVEVTEASHTTADLAGLFVRHVSTPDFTLNADRLTVENHHANVTLALRSRYSVEDEPRTLHDGPGLLTGHANRPTESLWVLPLDGHDLPTLTASAADCVVLEPPEKNTVEARAHVNTVDPVWSVNTAGAAALRTCTDATATVTGSFLLVLWEWDAILTASGEARALRTGHQDAHPGTPVDGAVGTADELFITVRDGALTLPLAPGAHELYLRAPRVEAEAWRFTHASGTLPGVVGDVEGTVRVMGSLAAMVTGAGAGALLGADVEGEPERVEVNGAPVVVTTSAPGTSRISVLAWAALAVAVGAAALLGCRARRSPDNATASVAGPNATAPTEPATDDPPTSGRRDVEAERRVLRVVESSPGVTVRELQQRTGVRAERTQAALDALLARGVVARRGSEARWHVFPPWSDLDERWRREVALRQEANRLLLGVLREHPGIDQPRLVALCRERLKWAPSTTKDRLRRLEAVGLAVAREAVSVTESVFREALSVAWTAA